VTPALHLGKAVHAALQAFHIARWRGGDDSPAAVAAAFDQAFNRVEREEGPVRFDGDTDREWNRFDGLAVVAAWFSGRARAPWPFLSPSAADFANARTYLDAHNAVRASVKPPADYKGAWVPIPPLAWSDELALSAQAWADHLKNDRKCKLEHSDTRNGENLAGGKGLDAKYAVKLWENEGKNFRWVPVYEFDIPSGHYSQVVWRKTTLVGCARVSCGRTVTIVCQYSPPGNHIGKSPY